jgi:hypothetical protein
MSKDDCSPGSTDNPHADQRKWRPATTLEEYARNCREGLEDYSDRRAAEILGVSRVWVWRAKMLAAIPKDLFERLLAADTPPSTKALAQIGQALSGRGKRHDVECCWNCGVVLRVRDRVAGPYRRIIAEWLAESGAA